MFSLDALDKLIAVVVVLLVLSLIVQSIQAAIKKFFRIKSLQLEHSLIHLFYYLLDKDSIKAMRSVSDRAPLLRAFFGLPFIRIFRSDHSKPPSARDPQIGALYEAVTEEFVRAGRVSPGGKMLIESVSKDELIKFIRLVKVSDLIKHIHLPELDNISALKVEIAGARKALNQFCARYPSLIEETRRAEIIEPLLKLFSNAPQLLDLKNSDLTLGELEALGLGPAAKTIDSAPDLIEKTLTRFRDDDEDEAAQALLKIRETLDPVYDALKSVIILPRKLGELPEKVDIWYDTIMRSFDERYTRTMKSFALAISFIVVVLLNANIFDIYREISADDLKRNQIVQSSDRLMAMLSEGSTANKEQIRQSLEELSKKSDYEINNSISLYTVMGFKGPRWIVDAWKDPKWPTAQKFVETLAGWLIMTMLLSVGAPFWQDTLESLFGLKNLLRKKEQEERSADR